MLTRTLRLAALATILLSASTPAVYAAFTDAFNYPDGDLQTVGSPPWQLTSVDSAASVTTVVNGVVRIDSGGADSPPGGQNRDLSVAVSETGLVTAQLDFKRGGAGSSGNMYSIEFNDAAGLNLARWYGKQDSYRPRIDGTVLTEVFLADDEWHTLTAVIDTVARTTTYYADNVLQGSLNHSGATGSTVAQILIRATTNIGFDPEEQVFIDNISLVPEPASLAALLVGGCLLVRRKSRG